MKKIAVLLTLLFSASNLFGFEYCYLLSDDEVDFVVSLLKDFEVSEENIELWKFYLDESIAEFDFSDPSYFGWLKAESYDRVLLPYYSDYVSGTYINCRIGTFPLYKNLISADKFIGSWRADVTMKEIPYLSEICNLTDEEITSYKALFSYVAMPVGEIGEDSYETALEQFQLSWKKEGLEFPEDENFGILQAVVVQQSESLSETAFGDHAGIIMREEDFYYVLERRSPLDPMIFSKHEDLDSVGEMFSFDVRQNFEDNEDSRVMVLCNDGILWTED